MAVIKCKMCGGDLPLMDGQSVAECEYCGSRQTVPNGDNEKKLQQFERAEWLRRNCEFDKAAAVYETIVSEYRQESEAYWGLVLCKYGIEYVDDPATGKKIPTCHRSGFDSIMDDPNLEMAMDYADAVARRVYREEAKQLEELRKDIIAVSSREEPYDIFICYKETDEAGERTLDSVLAQDIYDTLTDKGYRVFFARITLEDKLGQEYEPYIFAALNSAKIMLAIGTDYEYFHAVWVKNEWSRFLKLMVSDKTKHLIPCFKGIDAYDLPKEFAKLQAQDLGKVGAVQDLLRGIEKLLPKKTQAAAPAQHTAPVQSTADNYIKRGMLALEEGDWKDASRFFEEALNQNAEAAEAYFGLAMADFEVDSLEALIAEHAWEDKNYRRGKRYADAALRKKIEAMEQAAEAERIAREKREEEERIAREKQEAEERIARQKWEEEERIARKKREEEERIARKKREEEERIAREKALIERKKVLAPIRDNLKKVSGFISTNSYHTVGLKADGTVIATEYLDKYYCGQCNVSHWRDIVAIAAGHSHTVGLKADGTVVTVGQDKFGQCNVSHWRDIVAIAAESRHTVGLKADGTVVATKHTGQFYEGQCEVDHWTDIVAISAGLCQTVGLKADGTVVAVGNNDAGQCNVSHWRDIVAIAAGYEHTVGLKADGTVVAVGKNNAGQCNVGHWMDIVAIAVGSLCTIGLKADGTVVAAGNNARGKCNVSHWRNIVAIAARDHHTVGLKADGTVVAVGNNDAGQCNVSDWKLFQGLDSLEQDKLQMQRRAAGLCQHCGGALKGLFSKKCVSCGKPKDY